MGEYKSVQSSVVLGEVQPFPVKTLAIGKAGSFNMIPEDVRGRQLFVFFAVSRKPKTGNVTILKTQCTQQFTVMLSENAAQTARTVGGYIGFKTMKCIAVQKSAGADFCQLWTCIEIFQRMAVVKDVYKRQTVRTSAVFPAE